MGTEGTVQGVVNRALASEGRDPSQALFSRRMWDWLLIGIGSLAVMAPMLRWNYPHVHSYHFNMMWAFQYSQQFWGGQWYPRWLEGSWFGLGNPTFAFYPPLCMVAVLPFAVLPTSWALVGSMGLAVAVRGIGCYQMSRELWPRWIALLVAGLGMVSPYFLVDVYSRGAIAEVWGISLLPWLIWGGLRSIQGSRWLSLPLVITSALMALTHLPTLLITMLTWLVFPWCFGGIKTVGRIYGNTALGLATSSFFLLPAALDQRWISIDLINGWEMYNPLTRFPWVFHSAMAETDPWIRLHFAIPLILLAFITLWAVRRRPYRHQPGSLAAGFLRFTVLATLLASGMMTDLSAPIYQHWPTLARIQFPWRWQALTTTTMCLFWGFAWEWVTRSGLPLEKHARNWKQWGSLIGVGLAGVVVGGLGWHVTTAGFGTMGETLYNAPLAADFNARMSTRPPFPQEPFIDPFHHEHYLLWHHAYPQGIGFVDAFEYRPRSAANPIPPPRSYPLAEWWHGQGTIEITHWGYGSRDLMISAVQPGEIILRTLAYPSWRVWRNDRPWATQTAADGRLMVTVPVGTSQLRVRYAGTAAERWGNIITWGLIGGLAWVTVAPTVFSIRVRKDLPPRVVETEHL